MKTVIEVWHEDEESTSNWFATKSVTLWKDGGSSLGTETWQVNGTNLYVYDKEDIKALRKLLDAIEEQLEDND